MYGQACEIDFEWPWCPPASSPRTADLRIALGSLGQFADSGSSDYVPYLRRAAREPSRPPIMRVDRGRDGHFRIVYSDGAEFVIDASATEIRGMSHGELTVDDLLVYL